MFSRVLVVVLASLSLACGIALVFYKILGAPGYRPAPVKTHNVVVAAAELPVGARIRIEDIRIVAVPIELLPREYFEKIDEVKGRIVTSRVLQDEPVAPNRLAPPGSAPGLAPMIPAGYRAVSIRVNDVIGVAGFIQPGMRVDVLATGRLPGTEDSVTRTVLQNVAVLSAGQVLQAEPKGGVINAQVVTLQVRPDEAEILALTSGEGRIQLVLRNSSDTVVAPTAGAHLRAIYSVGEAPPRVAAQRHIEKAPAAKTPSVSGPPPVALPTPPRGVEVIRGTTRSEATTQEPVEKKKVTRRLYGFPANA